jgi:hypothetical protein
VKALPRKAAFGGVENLLAPGFLGLFVQFGHRWPDIKRMFVLYY